MAKVVVESGLIVKAVVPDAYLLPGMDSEGLGSMLRFIPCGQAREWKPLNWRLAKSVSQHRRQQHDQH
jgi:hypothetical protein